jgi:hypothetical protein
MKWVLTSDNASVMVLPLNKVPVDKLKNPIADREDTFTVRDYYHGFSA